MFPLPQATTAALPLPVVIAQLGQHPAVDGVVTIGLTLQTTISSASDYDLLIILNTMPVPLFVGITTIDHRLTDLMFATTAHVHTILTTTVPLDGETWEGRLARWLMGGHIHVDRHGQLQQAQTKVQYGPWIRPFAPLDSYGAWIGVNYNLLHTRRLFQSDDPVYHAAAELRIVLYGVSSLLLSYMRVRNLPWEGEKAVIRYLQAHDVPFLVRLQHLLRTGDLAEKMALYEQLATVTLAPIAPLWSGEPTVLWHDEQPNTWTTITEGLAFWETLVAGVAIAKQP
jgi:hypothetical protein